MCRIVQADRWKEKAWVGGDSTDTQCVVVRGRAGEQLERSSSFPATSPLSLEDPERLTAQRAAATRAARASQG